MWKDAKVAYTSVSGQIAMLFSAVAIFSYLSRALNIGLSAFFHQIVITYRDLFHPIADFFAGLFSLHLVDWQKDFLIAWLAVGGATSRTFFVEFVMNARHKVPAQTALALGLASILFWPVGWIALFSAPYLEKFRQFDGSREWWVYVRDSRRGPHSENAVMVCDMRVVLVIQLLTVMLVVGVMTIANAAKL